MKRRTEAVQPPAYDRADVMAFKALVAGVANDAQQKRALNWIINQACGTYDLSFRPGINGERDTSFAEGRRFVGLQIVKLVNFSGDLMNEAFKK